MTETGDTEPRLLKDRWLILIILLIAGASIWNSRALIFKPPKGYARFSDYGLSFLYPDDLNLWRVPINNDGSVINDGSGTISEQSGNVGWNSGNIDFDRGDREGYYQEATVMWVTKDAEPEEILDLFYTMVEVTARLRSRNVDMVKGSMASLTHRGHQATYQHLNYTSLESGETEPTTVYGMVGGFYCDKTERSIAIYYLDIFGFDTVYNEDEIHSSFRFYLDSIKCH
jgi:hypothetical protein